MYIVHVYNIHVLDIHLHVYNVHVYIVHVHVYNVHVLDILVHVYNVHVLDMHVHVLHVTTCMYLHMYFCRSQPQYLPNHQSTDNSHNESIHFDTG